MFKNISGKIRAMAYVTFWCGIGASVAVGFYLVSLDYPWCGFATIAGGSALSVIAAFVLYGFSTIVRHYDGSEAADEKKSENDATESGDKTGQKTSVEENRPKRCELCGRECSALEDCEIVDNLGTRYRSICPDCMAEKKAKKVKFIN